MKLLIKFLSLSVISILCILLLGYSSYTSLEEYANLAQQSKENETPNQIYFEREMIINSINADIWKAIYFQTQNNQEAIITIKSNLDKYSAQAYYKSNNNNLNFTNYLNSAKTVIQSLGTANLNDNITQFKLSLDTIHAENDLFHKQNQNLITKKEKENSKLLTNYLQWIIIITAFSIILTCFVSLFSYINLFNPLANIVEIMTLIINNDRSKEVPFTTRTDEIGDIARALEIFRSTSIENDRLEEQAKQQIKKAEEDRRNSMLSFSNNFDTRVKGIVDMVAVAVGKMSTASKELGQLATHTQKETTLLSSTALQTNTNIQEVSKATNEFSSAVNEISTQVTNSLEYARRAAEQTDQVNNVVLDLETKASAVSGIIDIINNITSQIDLLALNATIEAARAGDMGKGFAVVANEVKALATQTSKATEQINFQISGIQSSTNKAVESIQEITESVKTINKNSESIASAVKKQNTTSSFIAESMSKAATMFNSVSSGVAKVADSSDHYGNAASEIVSSAEDLLKQSSMLQSEVNKFLSSLRLT